MNIRQDEAQNLVFLDGITLEGWLDDSRCEGCGERRVYYLIYDAMFCPTCNEWLELRCDDPACPYCLTRPARPLEA